MIKKAYLAFIHFEDATCNSTTLVDYVMEGYLKKLVSEFKIFQAKTQLKRYFKLDFNYAIFHIQEEREGNQQSKQFKFSSIKAVWAP